MLSLRPRTGDDCPLIVSWVPDAQALYLFAGPRLRWPLNVDQLTEGEQAPGHTAWVAINTSSEPVGQFELTTHEGHAHLGRVLLDPAVRGRGLAHELVRLAVAKAHALGATSIDLNVATGNEPAVRTYKRAGFVETEQRPADDSRTMVLKPSAAIQIPAAHAPFDKRPAQH